MIKIKKPEISRINHFDSDDIIQIFGENFDENTELYVWYNKQTVEAGRIDVTSLLRKGDAQTMKAELAAGRLADPSHIDETEKMAPATPPEDVIVLKAEDVTPQVIYFGEQGGKPENGYHKWVEGKTCVMWLKNEVGFSAPYIANRPEIRTQSVTKIHPGGKLAIYGVGFGAPLYFSDGTHFAKQGIIKNVESGKIFPLTGIEETSYVYNVQHHMAEFEVGAHIPDGEYKLYIHSGTGGIFGWSEPVKLTVSSEYSITDYYRTKWNYCASKKATMPPCKIKTIYADDASPLADYTYKIQSAIDEVSLWMDGGIVALGSGVFPISSPITVKPGVVLLGSGSATVIKAGENANFTQNWDNFIFAKLGDGSKGCANDWFDLYKSHDQAALITLSENCGVDSLRLELGGGANIGILVANTQSEKADNVFVNKTEVDSLCLSELEYDGMYGATCAGFLCASRTTDLTVWSSIFKATIPFYILPARHTYTKVINNKIINSPKQVNESGLCGLRGAVVTNNEFIGGRRAFISQGGLSNCFIYQNRVSDIARASCAAETYMSEFGRGEWNGKAAKTGDTYIEIADVNYEDLFVYGKGEKFQNTKDAYNRYLFVLSGRGFGQYKKIIDVKKVKSGYRLILESPWRVTPDAETSFTIVFGTHHNLWIDNNTLLSNGHSQFFYHCGFENNIVGHQMDMAAGIYLYACHSNKHSIMADGSLKAVGAFNTISDCQHRSGGVGVYIYTNHHPYDNDEEWQDYAYTRGIFGNCIKRCAFDGAPGHTYTKNLKGWPEEKVKAAIRLDGGFNCVVNNHFGGFENEIHIDSECLGNCFARNRTTSDKLTFSGIGTPCGYDTRKE